MAKAEYRSSIRSKNLIKKALAKLLHEKDIAKITVSDIIREADISRGTFYAHYPDVHGVAEQIEQEELKNLMDYVEEVGMEILGDNPSLFIKEICDYLNKDREYYRMLTQSNMLNNFIVRIINIYYDGILKSLVDSKRSKNDADVYLLFASSGARAVLVSWICGEISCSSDELSEQLGKYLSACLEKYYED